MQDTTTLTLTPTERGFRFLTPHWHWRGQLALESDYLAAPPQLAFADAQHGWLWSQGRLYNSTDGGDTWQLLHGEFSPGLTVHGLWRVTPEQGYAFLSEEEKDVRSETGCVWHTRDGGHSFAPMTAIEVTPLLRELLSSPAAAQTAASHATQPPVNLPYRTLEWLRNDLNSSWPFDEITAGEQARQGRPLGVAYADGQLNVLTSDQLWRNEGGRWHLEWTGDYPPVAGAAAYQSPAGDWWLCGTVAEEGAYQEGLLARLTPTGWVSQFVARARFNDFAFRGAAQIITCGGQDEQSRLAALWLTADGGQKWKSVLIPGAASEFMELLEQSPNRYWLRDYYRGFSLLEYCPSK